MYAVIDSKFGVLRELLDALKTDDERRQLVGSVDAFSFTPLMLSAAGVCAQLLVDAGADLWAVDNAQHDAFDTAVLQDRPTVLTVLLAALETDAQRSAVANRTWVGGTTILMRAYSSATVERLLAAGADPAAVDDDGTDAIGHATLHRCASALGALLTALGFEARRQAVNRHNAAGNTPFMLASHATVAELLVSAGADIWAVNAAGHDAFDIRRLEPEVLRELMRALGTDKARQRVVARKRGKFKGLLREMCYLL
jgi:ankyrin repeat protein